MKTFLLLIFFTVMLFSVAFSQPYSKEFGNSLTINKIVAKDSSHIVLCSSFKGSYENFIESPEYRLSYYDVKLNNLDSLFSNSSFSTNHWACEYNYSKAREDYNVNNHQCYDSIFNYWGDLVSTQNIDSVYAEFCSRYSDKYIEECYSWKNEILSRGLFKFSLERNTMHLIVIENLVTDEQMKIVISGHDPNFPPYTIKQITFKPGMYHANLNNTENFSSETIVVERVIETPLPVFK